MAVNLAIFDGIILAWGLSSEDIHHSVLPSPHLQGQEYRGDLLSQLWIKSCCGV